MTHSRAMDTGWSELALQTKSQGVCDLILNLAPIMNRSALPWYILRDPQAPRLMLRVQAPLVARKHLPKVLSEELGESVIKDSDSRFVDADCIEIQGVMQGPSVQPLLADFFVQAQPLVTRLTERASDGRSAVLITCFDLMVSHCYAIDRGLFGRDGTPFPSAFMSFRSHADGFFIMSHDPDQARQRIERSRRALAPHLEKRLRALHAGFTCEVKPPRDAEAWYALVVSATPALAAYLDTQMQSQGEERQNEYLGDSNDISVSAFHQAIQNSPDYVHAMRNSSQFLTLRALFSLLYWTLRNLGLPLVDRYLLCHAVACCFEDVFALDSAAEIRNLAQAHRGESVTAHAGADLLDR